MQIFRLFVVVVSLFVFSAGCSNESNDSKELTPLVDDGQSAIIPMLPAHPLPGERKGSGKADSYDDYRLGNPSTYGITSAPKTPMRAVGQWESNHQGLLLGWTGSFPKTNAAIVQAAKAVTTVYVVHQGTAAKNDFLNQIKRGHRVVAVVKARIADGFPDIGKSGEMGDKIRLRFAKRASQRFTIEQIAFDQWAPTHRFAPAARQIIKSDDIPTLRGKCLATMRADIARAASYEDGLHGR